MIGRLAEACYEENEAFDTLIGAVADTIPGLLAKLTYLREIGEGQEAWMLSDREDIVLSLIKGIETSLRQSVLSANR